ncbi:NAD(P)H-quinone oxidoreductase subunit, putative [Actinidia rufa]|uniref:NAD(P)H-quinone oxidoreductase subunit, putative n=1 Tax=Actinidia rufa TaxID=165716 RepID=A0A7J0DJT5_9ERIC|nr:NAD(P)H-quinone oxidoreductase subunit, putative [Actinidia rufa]
MLRKRSTTTSKQTLMEDYGSISSPNDKYTKPTSSIFSSPSLFTAFASKSFTDSTESVMSPTSILDTKPFSASRNPCWSDPQTTKSPKPEIRTHWDTLDSGKVGLGIVDHLFDEKSDPKLSKPESRMVLFGSQLNIQIPPLPPSVLSPAESPKSPADFGIKTKKSPFGSANPNSPRVFTGCLSASEMELSEDYTRVISYGPNPKTTHIFDDCVVESCCGVVGLSAARNENGFLCESMDELSI